VHVVTALESLGPDGVEELLRLRPDLAQPSRSMRDLGARALHPQSLSIALRSFVPFSSRTWNPRQVPSSLLRRASVRHGTPITP
jgi:hypothetical protein